MAKKPVAVPAPKPPSVAVTKPVLEMRDPATITPYEKNPRKNDHAVAAVVKSIETYGFRVPIVVDSAGVIVTGHTRHKAALQMQLAKVPVIVAGDLTPDQAKAYRIADNRTSEIADWNKDLLRVELSDLSTLGIDMDSLGWDPDTLATLIAPAGNDGSGDPDNVPLPADNPTAKRGNIWALGAHRLMCGDSANPDDLDALLGGAKIHLVNTDPPYNVKVEPRSNNAIAAGNSSFSAAKKTHHQSLDLARYPGKGTKTTNQMRAKDRPLANDFVTDAAFDKLLDGWFGNIARVLIPGGGFYIWGGYANCANYPPVLKTHELYFSQAVIWIKEHPVLTRKDFMGNHEWCFYGWKEGAAHRFFGAANIPDTWFVKKVNPQNMVHLTEKPTELAKRAIEYSSRPGENVLDLFGGSGSTLIACEQTGRCAHLMELDEAYCDVIISRWQTFTGKRAVLLGTNDNKTPKPEPSKKK